MCPAKLTSVATSPPPSQTLVIGASSWKRLYPLCLHTEAIDRLPGWYEAAFNTPSHHRVHHGRGKKYRSRASFIEQNARGATRIS